MPVAGLSAEYEKGNLPGGAKVPAEAMLAPKGVKPAVSPVPAPKPAPQKPAKVTETVTSERNCDHCGKPLPAAAHTAQKYCNKACKDAFNKAKKAGE